MFAIVIKRTLRFKFQFISILSQTDKNIQFCYQSVRYHAQNLNEKINDLLADRQLS
jgi:hypothetical protein